ncbi:hypothetical protein SFR_1399 [Streptomyces sp. FR-008]|nr:hypothetical protein SFR_1399 [Streptomyces sp. FR-008]
MPSALRAAGRRGGTAGLARPSGAGGPARRAVRPAGAGRPPLPVRPRGGRPGVGPGGPRAPYGAGLGPGPSGQLPLRSSRHGRRSQGGRGRGGGGSGGGDGADVWGWVRECWRGLAEVGSMKG